MTRPTTPPHAEHAADATLWPIEGLRGLAAVMVMWWHLRPAVLEGRALDAFAYTGVDLFFVLSGFVFAPYVFGKPLALRPYLVRRVLRIYPLFIAALLVYAALRYAQGADPWRYLWQHLAMLHTAFSQEMAAYYNGAFWSLPVELEFYALVPLLAALVARSPRWFGAAVVFALLLHGALARWAVPGSVPMPVVLANVHWPGLWLEFLLGCAAWRAGSWPVVRRWAGTLLALAALLWLGAASVWVHLGDEGVLRHAWARGNLAPWAASAYALALAVLAAHMRSASAPAAHERPPLRVRAALLAGNLSYGIYLLHNAGRELAAWWWPQLPGWAHVLVAAVLTLCAAWLLHHSVEAPARAWGRQLSRRWQGERAAQPARGAEPGQRRTPPSPGGLVE